MFHGHPPPVCKVCFVTIGATASFSALVRAVISQSFVESLQINGYTELIVQYGADGKSLFTSLMEELDATGEPRCIKISGFGLDRQGLSNWMRLAKTGGNGGRGQEGVVISHAGSGTVLDAMRIVVPLVVVPNTELLDNHQIELAQVLSQMEYLVHGKLDNLPQALFDAEKLRVRHQQWPPVNSGEHRKPTGLSGVVDEELRYDRLDYLD